MNAGKNLALFQINSGIIHMDYGQVKPIIIYPNTLVLINAPTLSDDSLKAVTPNLQNLDAHFSRPLGPIHRSSALGQIHRKCYIFLLIYVTVPPVKRHVKNQIHIPIPRAIKTQMNLETLPSWSRLGHQSIKHYTFEGCVVFSKVQRKSNKYRVTVLVCCSIRTRSEKTIKFGLKSILFWSNRPENMKLISCARALAHLLQHLGYTSLRHVKNECQVEPIN